MPDDFLQQIKDADKGKEKKPLQIKYKAMAQDAFHFFRGTCNLFYAELAKNYPFPPSPNVWACGDLHIENFGSYKSSQRLVYFDVNDFDEALLAPALWEVARLTASVQLAAEQAKPKFSEAEILQFAKTLLFSYQITLAKGKAVISERDASRGLIEKLFIKVTSRKDADLVKKRTRRDNPNKLLVSEKLFAFEDKQEKKRLMNAFDEWLINNHKKLRVTDAGFRIAGTGSLGAKRYTMLLERTDKPGNKRLVDLKQAFPSATAHYVNTTQPGWNNQAERIVAVQEMMQYMAPAFLSAFQHDGNWFVVKDLQPMAEKVELNDLLGGRDQIENYFSDLGAITSAAQLRSSGRRGSATADELIDFANEGNWASVLAAWSSSYAQQLKQEYTSFKQAWADGFFD